MVIKASAPRGRFSSRDVNVVKPISLKTIEAKVEVAPLAVVVSMERIKTAQNWKLVNVSQVCFELSRGFSTPVLLDLSLSRISARSSSVNPLAVVGESGKMNHKVIDQNMVTTPATRYIYCQLASAPPVMWPKP